MDATKADVEGGAAFAPRRAVPEKDRSLGALDPSPLDSAVRVLETTAVNSGAPARTTINDLPEEVLHEAFQKLSASKDALSCLLVNKRWTIVACAAVRSVRLRRDHPMAAVPLSKALAKFSNLVEVDATALARAVDDKLLSAIGSTCPKISTLKLLGPSATDKGLSEIAKSCPELEVVELTLSEGFTAKGLEALAKGCTSLKTLILDGSDFVNNTALAVIASHCGALEVLSLGGIGRCAWQRGGFTVQGLAQVIEGCKMLTSLILVRCERLTALPQVLGRACNLKVLKLGFCRALSLLPESICMLDRLEELDVSNCSNLVRLPSHIGRLRSLRRLNISLCSKLTTLPETLGQLSALKELDLSFCSNLTALPDSLGGLFSLRRLDLAGCEGLAALPLSFTSLKLEKLSLAGCSGLAELLPATGGCQLGNHVRSLVMHQIAHNNWEQRRALVA